MKKGIEYIGKGSVLIWAIIVMGVWSCSKKTSAPIKELTPTAQAVTGSLQPVQTSTRSMYCNQIRSMRKQHKSE
jgi:hypothetical protein